MIKKEQADSGSDEEMARFHEEHKGDTALWKSSPVKIRVRRGGASTVFSLRLTPDELAELFQMAESQGVTTSEYIRHAALDAARHGKSHATSAVEKDLRSAKEAVERALTALKD